MSSKDNPFAKAAARPRDFKLSKDYLKSLSPEERKKLGKAQGLYGEAVAEAVRSSHRVWRKGRSGDKRYI